MVPSIRLPWCSPFRPEWRDSRSHLVEASDLPLHGDAGLQRVLHLLGKEGHDGIADVLVDEALVLLDDRTDPRQVGVQEVEVLLGAHPPESSVKARMSEREPPSLSGSGPPADLLDALSV